jgi:flagellar protein FlgJ
MSELASNGSLSAVIQVQRTVASPSVTRHSAALADQPSKLTAEDDKALDVARQFEALLVHNMLKGMRKTTLSENTSNERALYDDMLDEKLADTLMESGGLGVARQILDQIGSSKAQADPVTPRQSLSTADTLRLRELAQDIASNRPVSATTPESTQEQNQREFLNPLLPHARRNAQKLGTTPEAILAIAALETGWGKSVIKNPDGVDSHNLFGIKATSGSQPYAQTTTTEYINGTPVKSEARFRIFNDSADAVDGFASFLLENPRYAVALEHAADPERFIKELHQAGYATDPDYADKAISVMKQIENHAFPL